MYTYKVYKSTVRYVHDYYYYDCKTAKQCHQSVVELRTEGTVQCSGEERTLS